MFYGIINIIIIIIKCYIRNIFYDYVLMLEIKIIFIICFLYRWNVVIFITKFIVYCVRYELTKLWKDDTIVIMLPMKII